MDIEIATLHLKKDLSLQKIIQSTTIEVSSPTQNVYFDLLSSIVSQQLSVKAADTIFKRFCTLFPNDYPSPDALLALNPEQLRTAGLSNQKAGYMKNVAVFALENNLENHDWSNKSDAETIDFLTQIKGIGRWSAQMILMFTLGRPDIFPVDDLGIQQAISRLYNLNETGKNLRLRMDELAEPWRPYRTIACRYLWAWKDKI